MDSIAAFTHNGAIVLREVYSMACASCGIVPTAIAPSQPGFSGGRLAYSLFLGPEVESSWGGDVVHSVDGPHGMLSLWLRVLGAQPPGRDEVKASHKVSLTIILIRIGLLTSAHQTPLWLSWWL
jgi:hypothetical protein